MIKHTPSFQTSEQDVKFQEKKKIIGTLCANDKNLGVYMQFNLPNFDFDLCVYAKKPDFDFSWEADCPLFSQNRQ